MAEILRPLLNTIRVPQPTDRVYKDECVYSFDTPESPDGLYISLTTFIGLGKNHVTRYHRNTGHVVYLHLKRIRKEIKKADDSPPLKKPTRLAIGLEGGFDTNEKQFEFEETTSIVVMPDWLEIPCQDLPLQVSLAVAGVMAADDPLKQEEVAAMAGTWDGEARVKSRFAENLTQLDNGKTIPPSGWKCEQCDLTTNLWLNLTDGTILCGRKFFDGSGGNNHALEHFGEVKYPLAVKLGTINEKGGDVFSYEEDDMVEDPYLTKHLLHWGINIAAMTKTEKTMAELEIDLNQKVGEWDVIQESGAALTPLYGCGYTGIRNLGNSCYMNSVMQLVFTLPSFHKRYIDAGASLFDAVSHNPTQDFDVQMAKIGQGIFSGDYSQKPEKAVDIKLQAPSGIRPRMFKTLMGRGHSEFSTKRQQDAQEFLLHLVTLIERSSRGADNPTDCLKFGVEDRLECLSSHKVRYTKREEYCLSLPVPMEAVTNMAEVKAYQAQPKAAVLDPSKIVRPRIPLMSCFEAFALDHIVDDFFSTALNAKCRAQQYTRLTSFPDYLFIHLKKFTIGADWSPQKQDVSIDVPQEIDLAFLRSKGLQAGVEELLPETPTQQSAAVHIDEQLVGELMEAGFPFDACRKAVYHTCSSGLEAGMEWCIQHMADPDFSEPLILPQQTGTDFTPDDGALGMIMSMGFTRDQAIRALRATNNNVERAADWIFSHANELDEPMELQETPASGANSTSNLTDGSEKYSLVGFISHMGTSTLVGHYVCHILRDDHWVICNDEKVALSERPPRDLAYIYLYKRLPNS